MRRGTTPTITVTPTIERDGAEEILDLSGYDRVVLTFRSGATEWDFEKERMAFDEGVIAITLTQEETLEMTGLAEVQIRARVGAVAIASDIASVDVDRILMEGVLE